MRRRRWRVVLWSLSILVASIGVTVALPALCASGGSFSQIHAASAEGDVEKVGELLRRDPHLVGATARYGWTPLMYAAQGAHVDVVKVLLEAGANPHRTDQMGLSAADLVQMALNRYQRAERASLEKICRDNRVPDARREELLSRYDAKCLSGPRAKWERIHKLFYPSPVELNLAIEHEVVMPGQAFGVELAVHNSSSSQVVIRPEEGGLVHLELWSADASQGSPTASAVSRRRGGTPEHPVWSGELLSLTEQLQIPAGQTHELLRHSVDLEAAEGPPVASGPYRLTASLPLASGQQVVETSVIVSEYPLVVQLTGVEPVENALRLTVRLANHGDTDVHVPYGPKHTEAYLGVAVERLSWAPGLPPESMLAETETRPWYPVELNHHVMKPRDSLAFTCLVPIAGPWTPVQDYRVQVWYQAPVALVDADGTPQISHQTRWWSPPYVFRLSSEAETVSGDAESPDSEAP